VGVRGLWYISTASEHLSRGNIILARGERIMAADAVAALRAEIARLEKQLETRRRALAMLVETAPKATTTPTTRPASATAAQRPSRGPALPPGIPNYIYDNKGRKIKIGPKQVAAAFEKNKADHKGRATKIGPGHLITALHKIINPEKPVSRGNVRRLLIDMAKAKK
jgi:hypothetical protein